MEENKNVEVLNMEPTKEEVKVEKNEKKKSNRGLIVIIILLLLICCGLGGFIFVNKDKLFVTEPNEPETTEKNSTSKTEKKEELDINSSLVVNLYNRFNFVNSCYMSIDGLNNDNRVKLLIAYEEVKDSNFGMIQCSKVGARIGISYCDVTWNKEIAQAFGNNEELFNQLISEGYTQSLDPKLLKAKVEEIFGTDYAYKDEDFGLGHMVEPSCTFMHYDSNNNVYAKYSCAGGGTCAGGNQTLKSAYKLGDKLFIETDYIEDESIPVESKRISPGKSKVIYQFKQDKVNNNYVFEKVLEE